MPLHGQRYLHNDTIKIQEVIISRKKNGSESTGYKKTCVDSSFLRYNSHSSIADILSENSGISFKSYGMGGAAIPSFRGTGAGHTLLTWNSININNPMLGQSDFSLIPGGIIDNIQIYYGGGSMSLASGGIGGIINLETKPVWKKETQISINPGFGSFGQYSGLVKLRSGNFHFQSVTKAFIQSSENDFRYLNTEIGAEPVWQTRTNSQVRQRGLIQELYFRKTENVASARIWYESANRNLPSSLLTQQLNAGETQFDESLRTLLNYDIFGKKNKYSLTGAWLINRLDYTNRLASINSSNLSETITLKTKMESRIGRFTTLKVSLDDEFNYVKSNNYDQILHRNTTTFTVSAETNVNDRIGTMILLRDIIDDKTFLIPDFSAAIQYRILDEKDYFLKANISRNSKIPTMNDMYWIPGGNPDLKNEYAFIYELTYEMTHHISSSLILRNDLSVFKNNVSDMIQWHPGEYSYWTADNVKNVSSSGLESSLSLNYMSNHLTTRLNAAYSYTRATTVRSQTENDISIGKQLMYMPENMANGSLTVNYKIFYSSWLISLTGKRYITVDNSGYLPGYVLNNIITGIKINLKGNLLDINFHVNNLFNVNYQTVAYYPLPGRSYSVKLLIQILI